MNYLTWASEVRPSQPWKNGGYHRGGAIKIIDADGNHIIDITSEVHPQAQDALARVIVALPSIIQELVDGVESGCLEQVQMDCSIAALAKGGILVLGDAR